MKGLIVRHWSRCGCTPVQPTRRHPTQEKQQLITQHGETIRLRQRLFSDFFQYKSDSNWVLRCVRQVDGGQEEKDIRTEDEEDRDGLLLLGQQDGGDVRDDDDLSETYSKVMQERMGSPLTYRHEDGMNYTRIMDDLIVGSCLQTERDVDQLVSENVKTIMCLQEDSDMAYFSLDIDPIQSRCREVGSIDHIRHAIRDFDPYSLRRRLPEAVALITQNALKDGDGTTYVHCTAGLGRAPATALAYMWWVKGIPLDEAYEHLTSLRPCKPRVEAIREAVIDLLYGQEAIDVKITMKRLGMAKEILVAGLDVGWGQSIRMMPGKGYLPRAWVKRRLPPGEYQFKFIWVCSQVSV